MGIKSPTTPFLLPISASYSSNASNNAFRTGTLDSQGSSFIYEPFYQLSTCRNGRDRGRTNFRIDSSTPSLNSASPPPDHHKTIWLAAQALVDCVHDSCNTTRTRPGIALRTERIEGIKHARRILVIVGASWSCGRRIDDRRAGVAGSNTALDCGERI